MRKKNKKFLIINADDLGLDNAITDSIIVSHIKGIVTSSTVMVNMPSFEYAVRKIKEVPKLGVGIHFNLTEGYPVADKSRLSLLLDSSGAFKANIDQRKNLIYGKEKRRQVDLELKSQVEKLLDYGIKPTHYDSHHHITGVPIPFGASKSIAKKYGIDGARITNIAYKCERNAELNVKLRVLLKNVLVAPKIIIHKVNKALLRGDGFYTPDEKILPFHVLPKNKNYIDQFVNALLVIDDGVFEIALHPGMSKNNVEEVDEKDIRMRDYQIALSDKILKKIEDEEIKLVNYKNAFL